MPSSNRRRHARGLSWALFLVLMGFFAGPAVRAGSATAESVMSRGNAKARAMQQIPRDATVTRTKCEEISVGRLNFRYRCSVWYEDTPPAQP